MLILEKEKKGEIDYSISQSLDFINRFCSNLNLENDTNELCKHVCKKIEEYDLVSEKYTNFKGSRNNIFSIIYI